MRNESKVVNVHLTTENENLPQTRGAGKLADQETLDRGLNLTAAMHNLCPVGR